MPLFTVRRSLGDITKDDLDAAAFRAIVCAYEYPGMRWHESYWDVERGVLTCIYEAQNEAELVEHSNRSRIPCDDVRLVQVVRPEDFFPAIEATPEQPA